MAETSTAQSVSPERSTVSPAQPVSPERTLSPEQQEEQQQHHAPQHLQQPAPQPQQPLPQQYAPRNEPIATPYQNGQPQAAYHMEIPRPPTKKGWQITNDVLHVVIMVLSIMGIGFSFSLLRYQDYSPGNYYAEGEVALWGLIAGPIFVATLVWSLIEMITRFCRKWKAGVHPGAHVGVTLILWLAAIILGIMQAILTQFNHCDNYYDSSGDGECAPVSSSLNASTALLIITAVAEFVVFVGACAETHRRNTYARNVYMTVPPFLPPGTPGQMSFEQFQQQQYRQFLQYQQQQRQQNVAGEKTQPFVQQYPQQTQQPSHQVREFYSPGTAV